MVHKMGLILHVPYTVHITCDAEDIPLGRQFLLYLFFGVSRWTERVEVQDTTHIDWGSSAFTSYDDYATRACCTTLDSACLTSP
jgi:hypothetical protein